MKFSIITVNLNNLDGLKKTIESVISQSYTNYEYIIIDGGSTDGSKELIEQYMNKITYWVSEVDYGIYDAMNKGILNSKGEIVCFINSGDLYISNYSIEIAFNEISKSKANIFFGNFVHIEGKSNSAKLCNIPFIQYKSDLLKYFFAHPSTFYKLDLFKKIGLFRTDYRIVSDVDWYLNALIIHKEKYSQINFCTSVFFDGGISTTNMEVHSHEYKNMINKYFTIKQIIFFSGRTFGYLRSNFFIKIIMKLFQLELNRV